jgi:hypothetical protein
MIISFPVYSELVYSVYSEWVYSERVYSECLLAQRMAESERIGVARRCIVFARKNEALLAVC